MEIKIKENKAVTISKEEQAAIAANLLLSHFDLGGNKFIKDDKVFIETRHGNEFVRDATASEKAVDLVIKKLNQDFLDSAFLGEVEVKIAEILMAMPWDQFYCHTDKYNWFSARAHDYLDSLGEHQQKLAHRRLLKFSLFYSTRPEPDCKHGVLPKDCTLGCADF